MTPTPSRTPRVAANVPLPGAPDPPLSPRPDAPRACVGAALIIASPTDFDHPSPRLLLVVGSSAFGVPVPGGRDPEDARETPGRSIAYNLAWTKMPDRRREPEPPDVRRVALTLRHRRRCGRARARRTPGWRDARALRRRPPGEGLAAAAGRPDPAARRAARALCRGSQAARPVRPEGRGALPPGVLPPPPRAQGGVRPARPRLRLRPHPGPHPRADRDARRGVPRPPRRRPWIGRTTGGSGRRSSSRPSRPPTSSG